MSGQSLQAEVRRAYLQHPLGRRLAALMVLAGAVAVLLAGMGIMGLAASNESLRAMHEQRMTPVRQLSRVHQLILTNRLLLRTALSAVQLQNGPSDSATLVMDAHIARASADAMEENLATIADLWRAYTSRPLTALEVQLARRLDQHRQNYISQALLPAIRALRANNYQVAQGADRVATEFFEDLGPHLDTLSMLQFDMANEDYQSAIERYQRTRSWAVIALVVSMLVMSWLGLMLIRSIVRPLQRMIETFRQISMGNYETPIHIEGADEISEVMRELQVMQTKLGADEAAIHQLAFYDPLTNLPNRRLLRDRLQIALNVSERSHLYGAVLILDLDNFKTINDTKGHAVGDDLLVEMSRRITGCLRQADTVARLGGDEFVVMLVNLSTDAALAAVQAEGIGEKLLHAIRQPCTLAGQSHEHSASAGICLFQGQGIGIDELFKRADLAMYQAKSNGRDGQRFFDPKIQAALESRMVLEVELRQALPQNQLELFYQVQVDNSERMLGAEVLLRWRHPARGLVSPLDFIPIAEESGLIVPIGEWVLQTACQQLKRWEADPATAHFLLSVNVSARQFSQANFVSMVEQALDHSGIQTDRLKLELTESLVLHNVSDTVTKMKTLNARGIQFSMDDFGTGYSSLSQLNRLPIAQLKIDRSFVSNITSNRHDEVIVQTIIGMANNLGVAVIAEGVETEAQRNLLEQLGCLAYQGYLFGRPTPLADFETMAQAACVTSPGS